MTNLSTDVAEATDATDEATDDATDADIDAAVAAAARAFAGRDRDPRAVAALLDRLAELVEDDADELIATAARESRLGLPRLTGEIARTTGQLRMLADAARSLERLDLAIDTARDGQPDVRRMRIPLGPVAVFEASNFPFAFGVFGGDTASALAAGCPVVVKAHPAHPATAQRFARIGTAALDGLGLDPGWISVVHGGSPRVGTRLVQAPAVTAVGFTGSLGGGRALLAAVATRPDPIPVYAEMGAINPLVVLPGATHGRLDTVADAIVTALTGSAGQLCTKPGLVVVPADDEGAALTAAVTERFAATTAVGMLTPGIADAFSGLVGSSTSVAGVEVLASQGGAAEVAPAGVLARADAATWSATAELREEHFGPFGVVVPVTPAELPTVLAGLDGTLAASLWLPAEPDDTARATLDALVAVAGRVIVDGTSAGVRVGTATQHGGPWPATSTPRDTSVGTASIDRYLRAVAWQSTPDALLPEALRDANPLGVERTVDGRHGTGPITR